MPTPAARRPWQVGVPPRPWRKGKRENGEKEKGDHLEALPFPLLPISPLSPLRRRLHLSEHEIAVGAHATRPARAHQFEDADQQSAAGTLGMWAFLATEVMFFG